MVLGLFHSVLEGGGGGEGTEFVGRTIRASSFDENEERLPETGAMRFMTKSPTRAVREKGASLQGLGSQGFIGLIRPPSLKPR